ncbi:MAG: proton/glutamate symporter [Gammaproteobacteria bacterium]|nr:MAG: proton/glutamate symporter [Gammaproteobacteria bacterium]
MSAAPDAGAALTRRVLLALLAGLVVGLALAPFAGEGALREQLVDGVLQIGGALFVAALKMLVVPLVFVSLVWGVSGLGGGAALGRLAARTLALYLATTAVAVTLALTLAAAVRPGAGLARPESVDFQPPEAPPLGRVFLDLVPENPLAAMVEGQMLGVIVFALLFGLAMSRAPGGAPKLKALFDELNETLLRLVMMVMAAAPLGVFCLIARTFAVEGLEALWALARYAGTVAGALLLHVALVYGGLVKGLARLPVRPFFAKLRAVQLFAFSTSSSNATLPVTLRTVQTRLGVSESVAAFTLPLGATVNMDGTAIMQGVAAVFVANVYGVDLGLGQFLTVILTATLASIGAAGVPGIGLITLTLVLQQIGLPLEAIGLIWGVDRLLDMLRTAVNVTGDAAVTVVVARAEGRLDEARYRDPAA